MTVNCNQFLFAFKGLIVVCSKLGKVVADTQHRKMSSPRKGMTNQGIILFLPSEGRNNRLVVGP